MLFWCFATRRRFSCLGGGVDVVGGAVGVVIEPSIQRSVGFPSQVLRKQVVAAQGRRGSSHGAPGLPAPPWSGQQRTRCKFVIEQVVALEHPCPVCDAPGRCTVANAPMHHYPLGMTFRWSPCLQCGLSLLLSFVEHFPSSVGCTNANILRLHILSD